MLGPHPRRRPVRDDVLLQRTHVRDWAPPGWHWEVLPSGARRLVRNPTPSPVVDPDLLWWRSRGPLSVRREPVMTHKYRGSIIVLLISKSVEPNEEQEEMTSGFRQALVHVSPK